MLSAHLLPVITHSLSCTIPESGKYQALPKSGTLGDFTYHAVCWSSAVFNKHNLSRFPGKYHPFSLFKVCQKPWSVLAPYLAMWDYVFNFETVEQHKMPHSLCSICNLLHKSGMPSLQPVCVLCHAGKNGLLSSLLLWRYSKPACTRSCASCFRWLCFGRGVGLDDSQTSLPNPTTLWFCDIQWAAVGALYRGSLGKTDLPNSRFLLLKELLPHSC